MRPLQAPSELAVGRVDPNETLTEDAADDLATAQPARTSQTHAESGATLPAGVPTTAATQGRAPARRTCSPASRTCAAAADTTGYGTRVRRSEQAVYRIDSIVSKHLEDGTEQMVVGKRTSKNDHWSAAASTASAIQ
ncbi:hypothetical protein ACH4E7_31750 [Kitasatospora sp. NPDC018058]|uniref:hypothetical protein n=1 Tax=Kitasatospora sp. NPDC018058 TaxID=3364025 RepID=UPI0037BEA874